MTDLEIRQWYVVSDLLLERSVGDDLFKRVGVVRLSRSLLHEKPLFVMEIFSHVIPFSIAILQRSGYIEYHGYSPLFDPISDAMNVEHFPVYRFGTAVVESADCGSEAELGAKNTVLVISKDSNPKYISNIAKIIN